MTNQEIKIKALKNITLFNNVSEDLISKFVETVHEKVYSPGELIFNENSEDSFLYLIVDGTIKITKKTTHEIEPAIGIFHPGDFFGELELIDGLPRSATATSLTDSKLFLLNRDDFNKIISSSPQAAHNLLLTLSLRLRSINETFIRNFANYIEATKNKIEKFHQLLEAAELVNSTLDLDRLLPIILSNAVNATDADRGTVFLIDETKREIWSKVFQGNGLVEIRLPIGSGIAGKVAESGITINISDAYKDNRFNPDIDKQTGYTTKSILCMSMKNKDGKILGVFQLLNKKKGNFTVEDEDYINAFSLHASMAIANASLAQQMVQSERLSAVGRMASTIIHDIKNPMATMRLYTQLLKTKVGNDEAASMTDEILRQIDRFVKMTQEVLDFSKGVAATNFEVTDIKQFINEVIPFIEKDFAKRNISIIKNIRFEGMAKLDPDKMMRVIYNLASNAADAMNDGGNFTITVSQENTFLKIEFADTGTGMTEEIKSKIFEPFFSYGKKHGTGLGMAIVKKIIEDHNGTIEIDSEIGKGTTLKIKLPIV